MQKTPFRISLKKKKKKELVNLIFLPHSFTGHKFDDCYRWSFKPITNSTATTWLKDGTDWTFFNNLIYDDCGMCHIELISTKPIIKSKLLLNVELSKTKLQLTTFNAIECCIVHSNQFYIIEVYVTAKSVWTKSQRNLIWSHS